MPIRNSRRRVSSEGRVPWSIVSVCSKLTEAYRHTPYAEAATIEQGVVIDLKNMPSPGLAPDHKTITVSPSQTWDQVFATLDAFDLATLGGRVGGVGVGGLTTGCE